MSFEMEPYKIKTGRTARYFMSGPITAQTRSVWIVLHGYAQHAGYFLKKFEPLFNAADVFVAPEGLSRFYVKGSSGKVGASWMTREDRQDEINDYVNYLDQLVQSLGIPEEISLKVLGFSQGVATVSRWVALGNINPQHIVLYAGVFPPDLEPGFDGQKWKDKRIDVLIGNRDEFYRVQDFTPGFHILQKVNPAVKIHEFEGGHEIFPEVLRKLLQ